MINPAITLTPNEIKLQNICELVTRQVTGNGFLTASEANAYQDLQIATGKNWDAINRRFEILS
jgi:hypothetical protein